MEGWKDSPARLAWSRHLIDAVRANPEDVICGFCGGPNTSVDDCGFWYLDPLGTGTSKPACETCHNGLPGDMHVERYGLGER